MYTLTLSDGTQVSGLTLKENVFYSASKLSAEIFAGKLNGVRITRSEDGTDGVDWDNLEGVHEHMAVAYIREVDGKYALALREVGREEYLREKFAGDIEYLAMMTEVELDG